MSEIATLSVIAKLVLFDNDLWLETGEVTPILACITDEQLTEAINELQSLGLMELCVEA